MATSAIAATRPTTATRIHVRLTAGGAQERAIASHTPARPVGSRSRGAYPISRGSTSVRDGGGPESCPLASSETTSSVAGSTSSIATESGAGRRRRMSQRMVPRYTARRAGASRDAEEPARSRGQRQRGPGRGGHDRRRWGAARQVHLVELPRCQRDVEDRILLAGVEGNDDRARRA